MRLSGTLSRAISTSRGFGNQLYDLAGERPSLDLPFADQKSLVDAATGSQPVTFTRASSGTYVDSQGVIRTATTNLLLRSEEFNDAYWTKSATSITANDIASPVGTITADKLVEDSANSQHTIGSQSISWLGNTQYTFTLYAKAAGRDTFDLLLGTAGNWVNSNRVAIFNLTSGVVEFQDGSPVSASIQNIGGGWFRCRITSTTVASPSASAVFLRLYDKSTATGGSSSYQGNGSSGVHIWGAQLEQSSTVGEYIPTGATINSAPRFDHNPTTGECLGLLVEEQRMNLAFPSNMPTSTTQTTTGNMQANGATQITSGVVAPDGSTNGFTVSGASVTTNTSGSNNVRILNVMAAAGTHTVSMWIKTNTSPTTVTVRDATTAISFNFTTTSAWTRISATFNNTSAGNIVLLSTSGAAFDCFGVQVESGSFPTSYIPTTTATATRSADVASITGSNFGTTRTNLLLQSEDFSTTWTASNLTVTTNSVVAPDGTATADTIAPPADGLTVTRFLRQNPVLTTQQAYTLSVFVKVGTATTNGIALYVSDSTATNNFRSNFNLINLTTSATSTGWATPTATIVPYPNGWYRCILSGVTSTAHTGLRAQIYLSAFGTTPDTYGSIHIWGAQLEAGSTATAYIPTTTAAASVFESSWYRQDEGTVFAETQLATNRNYSGTFRHLMQATPASNNDSAVGLFVNSANQFSLQVRNNNANQAVIDTGTNSGLTHRVAGVYKVDDFAISANGGSAAVDISGSAPTTTAISQMTIGGVRDGNTLGILNGTIRRLTYWPQRLPNSTLQQITQ